MNKVLGITVGMPENIYCNGSTSYSVRFGYGTRLYSRSRSTKKWTCAYDKGVWLSVAEFDGPTEEELEALYKEWCISGPLDARRHAIRNGWSL